MKHVPLKVKVVELLEKSHSLTAPQLVELLHTYGRDVHKTTVYRTLEALIADGVISRQSFGGNEIHYEVLKNHHDHAVCINCGKVIKVACALLVPKVNGFLVKYHQTTWFGYCKDCRELA